MHTCTMLNVQCVQCTMYIVHVYTCKLYTCTMLNVKVYTCKLYTCTMLNVQCTLHKCTLYIQHCIPSGVKVPGVHFVLYTDRFFLSVYNGYIHLVMYTCKLVDLLRRSTS